MFTSELTKKEKLFAALGLLLHVIIMPDILAALIYKGRIDSVTGNFLLYALMSVYVLIFLRGFLRRDFDVLADSPFRIVIEVLGSYLALMFLNSAAALLLSLFVSTGNPNDSSVAEMARSSSGLTASMTIYLAPIVEELLFRGFLFSSLRKRGRAAAYVTVTLFFALYHLYGFIAVDFTNIIFLIQYIPAGILLCRCYERTNTVWSPIALHMLVNAVSLKSMELL